jgi:gamma-glutamyltranspeptidase/glutathione hydrolase
MMRMIERALTAPINARGARQVSECGVAAAAWIDSGMELCPEVGDRRRGGHKKVGVIGRSKGPIMATHRRVGLALALIVVLAPATAARELPPLAKTYIVVTANPMASEAAITMLRAGGSAVDAAIAAQMALGVVEPQASGIGGGGFLMHYDARSRQVTGWDGRETAPTGAHDAMFVSERTAMLVPQAAVSGLSVGVPGAMRMLEEVHRRYGKLPWHDLFAPAIGLAEDGFRVPPRLAQSLATDVALRDDVQARAIYFKDDGAPRQQGEIMRNPVLAGTMRLLADGGADALYGGPLATEIVAAVRREPRPGSMTLEDLAAYRMLQRTPLCRSASRDALAADRDPLTICGMGPPTSGTIAVLQTLHLAWQYGYRAAPLSLRPSSEVQCEDMPEHELAEAGRLVFADRDHWVADPAFAAVPVDGLLDERYLDLRRSAINPCRSMGTAKPGRPPGAPIPLPASAPVKPEAGTSHMVIVDRDGNVVSFTTTINGMFGARRMVGGFLLNNELTNFSLAPLIDGRPAANRVQPGKRPLSSMTPLIAIDRDGRFVFALGSAGGSSIIGDVAQTTLRLLHDERQTLQYAIAAPRLLNRNGVTEVELHSTASAIAEQLRALGDEVTIAPHQGGLHGVRAHYDDAGKFIGYEGGADPRRDGDVRGE